METGFAVKRAPEANALDVMYTVPTGAWVAASIYVCNRGPTNAIVKVGISDGAAFTNPDWIEPAAEVEANGGTLERGVFIAVEGENFLVQDSTGTCSYRLSGVRNGG